MRRKRALFAVAVVFVTLFLGFAVGVNGAGRHLLRAAEASHAENLTRDLKRSAVFEYFPSAYELSATEIEPLPAQF